MQNGSSFQPQNGNTGSQSPPAQNGSSFQSQSTQNGNSSYQQPNGNSSFQQPNGSNTFQQPNGSNTFQQPNGSSSFQQPNGGNSFQTPQSQGFQNGSPNQTEPAFSRTFPSTSGPIRTDLNASRPLACDRDNAQPHNGHFRSGFQNVNENDATATSHEKAFLNALHTNGLDPEVQLVLMLPLQMMQMLYQKGQINEIAKRAKCSIECQETGCDCQVILRGSAVANSLAVLYLQEKLLLY